jgi:hypothetical protein
MKWIVLPTVTQVSPDVRPDTARTPVGHPSDTRRSPPDTRSALHFIPPDDPPLLGHHVRTGCDRSCAVPLPKMLAQLQRLPLIITPHIASIKNVRHLGHALVHEAADDLSVVEDERHLVAAHLQHHARA